MPHTKKLPTTSLVPVRILLYCDVGVVWLFSLCKIQVRHYIRIHLVHVNKRYGMQELGTFLLIAHEHDLATLLTEGRDLIWGNADLLIMLQRCEHGWVRNGLSVPVLKTGKFSYHILQGLHKKICSTLHLSFEEWLSLVNAVILVVSKRHWQCFEFFIWILFGTLKKFVEFIS